MRSSLEKKIECTREAMKNVAKVEGISAPRTIKLSRKLDDLLNQFDMDEGKTRRCKIFVQSHTFDQKL